MAYDPGTGDMVLFGGYGGSGYLHDTWTYGPTQYAPTVSQTLPASPVLVNTTVTDTASLTGASPTAGGTVSYSVYSDSGCTDPVASLGTSVAVTNGVPGSSEPWTATAGEYWFEATYSGDTSDAGPVSSSCVPLTVDNPAISLVESASPTSFTGTGQTVDYSYVVTNTGNVTLTSVGVTDTAVADISCPSATLAAGASETCTGSHTTAQADVTTGSITDTGTATGAAPIGGNVTATDGLTIPYSQITLAKSANPASFLAAGQPINYSYLVTNTGTTTVNNLSVNDSQLGTITCPSTSLTSEASETCMATYTTTSTDVTNGSITNTATANGTDQEGNPVSATSNTVTVPYSGLSLTKSTTSTGYGAAGQSIPYSYLVTNTGTTTISAIGISDNEIASGISCPDSTLAPGASEPCTGTYTTTQADVDTGSVTNTATASGTDSFDTTVTSNPSTVTVPANEATSSLSLSKSTTSTGYGAAGQSIPYNYLVTNTGTTTISSIGISDNRIASADISCPDSSLAPGASEPCTGSYTATQADVDAGSVTNTATATGTNPQDTTVTSNPSTVTVEASQATTSLNLVKSTTSTGYGAAGQTIDYDYLITNTGTTSIVYKSITLSDNKIAVLHLS